MENVLTLLSAVLPFFSKTTGISNTESSLLGQQVNVAQGTHIMAFLPKPQDKHDFYKKMPILPLQILPPDFCSDSEERL